MTNRGGKASVYLLFLVVGLMLGAIGGAEVIRRFYKPRPTRSGDATQTALVAKETQSQPATHQSPPSEIAQQQVAGSRTNAIVEATREVSPCVVGIVVTQIHVVRTRYYTGDFLDFFFAPELRPRYKEVQSMGSGFLIDKDGFILTSHHVVEGALKLYVNLASGFEIEGKVVGADRETDLALVKIERKNCPYVKLGNSDKLMIGEWAIAIGNPFGYFIKGSHPTVTVGVISALNRNFAPQKGQEVFYQRMIQTDAAINQGNSGGPLVNALGEVVGINTFIFTGSSNFQGSIGIGFAVPINRARRVVRELRKYGKRRPLWTGIAVQNLNRSIALSLGYDSMEGVVVTSVARGSPGAQAGLAPGDIVRKMGDRTIQSSQDIEGLFMDYFVGDTVKMRYVRNGKTRTASLVLKQNPGQR